MKKLLCLLMTIAIIFAAIGCKKQAAADPASPEYVIGIITGSAQDSEEYLAALKMQEKHGNIISVYSSDMPGAAAIALASDPKVKALIFMNTPSGACAAADEARKLNPDMLIIFCEPGEDAAAVGGKADFALMTDEIGMGATIPVKAAEMGAKTLIHYSYSGLVSTPVVAACRELMLQTCMDNNMLYLDVTAPDPTGGAGEEAAVQFISDDVQRQIAQYGKDTAFFSASPAMQAPLIKASLEHGAIFPQQCHPSPLAYARALGIDMAGREGDTSFALDKIKSKLAEHDQQGRMSTWGVSLDRLTMEASVEYSIRFLDGTTDGRVDETVLLSIIKKLAGGEDKCSISNFTLNDMSIPNVYGLLMDYYDFK